MIKQWHGGKGPAYRKAQVSLEQRDLRHELWQKTTPPERKLEIEKRLEELKLLE